MGNQIENKIGNELDTGAVYLLRRVVRDPYRPHGPRLCTYLSYRILQIYLTMIFVLILASTLGPEDVLYPKPCKP